MSFVGDGLLDEEEQGECKWIEMWDSEEPMINVSAVTS